MWQGLWPGAPVVRVSARAREGVAPLEEALARTALVGAAQSADPLVASARHADALRRVAESLAAALATLETRAPLDFVALDTARGARRARRDHRRDGHR